MGAQKPLVIIAGLGEGLGSGLADFFIGKGYQVIGLNRSAISPSSKSWSEYLLDLSDEGQVQKTVNAVVKNHGVPDVLIHNTQQLMIEDFESTTADQFEACWRSMTLSAFLLAQSFLPEMKDKGGTINGCTMIVTGATASIRGGAKFAAFSSAKFALRGLVQSLARSYQKQGVHIAHVLLDGIIDTESSRQLHQLDTERMIQPEAIAEMYWQLANQPKSAWVHELDIRPSVENF